MDITNFDTALLCALIFFAGFVDSIAGGGGLISLPAYFAIGLKPHMALATNKFSSSFGTLTSVIRYYKAGRINLRIGITAAIGALAGAVIGARLALWVSAGTIGTVMIVLVPAVLGFFLLQNRIMPPKESAEDVSQRITKAFAVGAVVGCYDGFFGPGTGVFLAIGFNALLRLDLVGSAANARFVNLASNVASLAIFLINQKVFFPLAFYTAAFGIAGNFIGSKLALEKGERIVKPLMVFVLILLLAEVVRQRFIS